LDSLAVEVRETRKVVGTLEFRFLDVAFDQVEISLTSNEKIDLPGLESEAFETALDYCFQELNIHRVVSRCGADETELRTILNGLGMRQEAEFLKHVRVRDEWLSTVWFALLEEEYFREATEKK